jgi:AmmeMemoRadiSam system protein B
MVRPPAVAGRFYPGDPATLLRDVRSYTQSGECKLAARGCVVPHAGYMYSGHVAGAVYAALELPRRFLILCPNHTGAGEPLAMYRQGRWRTPLGEVAVDEELAAELQRHCDWLSDDPEAHRSEHALEVQLPFLQAMVGDFTFVPIAVGVGQYEPLAALGQAMARALAGREREVLIVASSDMNHYESDAITREKDAKAIQRMLALDPPGLYRVVKAEPVSMCGYGPAVAMMTASLALGAKEARLIKYATSADTSGDREFCVGYAGIAVI